MNDPLSTVIDRRDAELAQIGLVEIARRLRVRGQEGQASKIETVAKALLTDHIHIAEEGPRIMS